MKQSIPVLEKVVSSVRFEKRKGTMKLGKDFSWIRSSQKVQCKPRKTSVFLSFVFASAMEENKKLRPKRRRLPTRTKFDPTSHRPVSPSVVPGMDVWTSPSTPNALEEHDQDPSPVTVGTPNRDPSMTPRTMQRHRQRLANITERLKSLAAEKDDNDSGLDLSSHIVLPRNLEELFKGNGRTYRTIKESVSVREYGAPRCTKRNRNNE